jgi:hypothetical protein
MKELKIITMPYRIICNQEYNDFSGVYNGFPSKIHFTKGSVWFSCKLSTGYIIIFNHHSSVLFSEGTALSNIFTIDKPSTEWKPTVDRLNKNCGEYRTILY